MTAQQTKAELIAEATASARAEVAKLEEALDRFYNPACTSIVSHSWVVLNDSDMVMGFKLEKQATGSRYDVVDGYIDYGKNAANCSRYVKQDAITLAGSFTDGAGNKGKAMHWVDAAELQVKASKEFIASMEAYL